MKLTKILAALSLAGLLAPALMTPAMAGGLTSPAPEPTVTAPVAYQSPSGDWNGGWAALNLGYGHAGAGGASGNGAIYGASGGYDWDLGQWVVGAGVGWDKTNIGLGGGNGIDDIARLKFRVGSDLGQTLVYATAGAARANATVGGTSGRDTGWFGGIGADYQMAGGWTVGGELLTNRFNNFNGGGTDLRATTATINVGFRF